MALKTVEIVYNFQAAKHGDYATTAAEAAIASALRRGFKVEGFSAFPAASGIDAHSAGTATLLIKEA